METQTSTPPKTNNDWSEIQEPNKSIPYHHIILKTPLGQFVIDWKGWKERPTYDLYDLSLNDEWLSSPYDLESGKEFVKNYLLTTAETLNKYIEGMSK